MRIIIRKILLILIIAILLTACGAGEGYVYEITVTDNVTGERTTVIGDYYDDFPEEEYNNIVVYKDKKIIADIGGDINFKVIRKKLDKNT